MTDLLAKLPLFATDREIAIAVVGKERATMWVKTVIPQLERKGFPRIDPLHDGRPVPLVKKFYDGYFGITAATGTPSTALKAAEETIPVGDRRPDQKPKLDLDSRSQTVLRYMIAHPGAKTRRDIRGVGEATLRKVAAYGVIEGGEPDKHGDRIWSVTSIGRDEIGRIDYWFYGKAI